MKNKYLISLICCVQIFSGCAWFGSAENEPEEGSDGYSEKDFYDKIQSGLESGNWSVAIANLQMLESQFPFGKYAEQGQLELIYSHYKTGDYEACVSTAERFLRLHPQHLNVDYALYLKGLAEIQQTSGFFDSFLPTDNTLRDIGTAREAFSTLRDLIIRFPDSRYSQDARARLVSLRNTLARSEIHAANYYFSRGAYLAAANRGRYVIENFQRTPSVPDGLAVTAQAYEMLGMSELSDNAVRVLVANFPDYPQLDAEGNFDFNARLLSQADSLLDKITFGRISRGEPPAFDTRNIYKFSKDIAPRGAQQRGECSENTFGGEGYFAKVERLADKLDRSIKALLPQRLVGEMECDIDQAAGQEVDEVRNP
ncbi:MAG: outer membrane protein assembly factor BamD [Cellvibrionales bacterium TMED49]|nr:MAG: outer membrane protein assembly factor BamD [Cellvibrionales bacterium TMED49]